MTNRLWHEGQIGPVSMRSQRPQRRRLQVDQNQIVETFWMPALALPIFLNIGQDHRITSSCCNLRNSEPSDRANNADRLYFCHVNSPNKVINKRALSIATGNYPP